MRLSILAILSIFILSSCQSDLLGNAISAIPSDQADCIDSDNGVNFREPGTATLTYTNGQPPKSIKDRCTFTGKLYEGQCKTEVIKDTEYIKLTGVSIRCPSQPIKTTCLDTPNGAFCNPQE